MRSLIGFHEVGQQVGIADGLKGLADIQVYQRGELQRAVQLFGAADALLATIGAGITPRDRVDADILFTSVHAILDSSTFTAAWASGQALPVKQAIALALE